MSLVLLVLLSCKVLKYSLGSVLQSFMGRHAVVLLQPWSTALLRLPDHPHPLVPSQGLAAVAAVPDWIVTLHATCVSFSGLPLPKNNSKELMVQSRQRPLLYARLSTGERHTFGGPVLHLGSFTCFLSRDRDAASQDPRTTDQLLPCNLARALRKNS